MYASRQHFNLYKWKKQFIVCCTNFNINKWALYLSLRLKTNDNRRKVLTQLFTENLF